MQSQSSLRPLAEPLRLGAIELHELSRLGDQLQHILVRLTECVGAPDDDGFITEAQAADLLSQRLEGMAAFLDALARAVPPDAMIDVEAAVFDLTLAEQARRLSGPHAVAAAACQPVSGDLFMFEG